MIGTCGFWGDLWLQICIPTPMGDRKLAPEIGRLAQEGGFRAWFVPSPDQNSGRALVELISLVLSSIGILGPGHSHQRLHMETQASHCFWLATGRRLTNRSGTSRFLETTFYTPPPQFYKVMTTFEQVSLNQSCNKPMKRVSSQEVLVANNRNSNSNGHFEAEEQLTHRQGA